MIANYDRSIEEAVVNYLPDYDWRLLKAQYWQESRLQPDALSPAGAQGIAQFMPGTWKRYGKGDPFDPYASIDAGAQYMRYLIGQWSWPRPVIDRHCLALASYNAGLGNILKAQELSGGKTLYADIIQHLPDVTGRHATETTEYVRKILWFWMLGVVK